MSIRFFKQLRVLLWKNFKLKCRRPILFAIELLIPLALCIILAQVRKTKPPTVMKPSYHYATGLPSAGLIPFIQGLPVVGCWDYEKHDVEYYPLPSWFSELPKIEVAFRKIAAWPLISDESNKVPFANFLINDLHLTERESKALAVSTANLTKGVPVNQFNEVFSWLLSVVERARLKKKVSDSASMAQLMVGLMAGDIGSLFHDQVQELACNNDIQSILDLPQDLTAKELTDINIRLCEMDKKQRATFEQSTTPDQTIMSLEIAEFISLLRGAFYEIPLGAQYPVLTTFRKSIKQGYRATRTTLALVKYYLCPTLKPDMETFFVNLEQDMMRAASKQTKRSPPLYPREDESEEHRSPQQPHRRSASSNIFNTSPDSTNVSLSESSVFNKTASPVLSRRKRDEPKALGEKEKHKIEDNAMPKFVQTVKKGLESDDSEMSVVESDIWYTITQGKLFYSPRTPIVDELIRQANTSFSRMADLITGIDTLNTKILTMTEAYENDPVQHMKLNLFIQLLSKTMNIDTPDNVTAIATEFSGFLTMLTKVPNYFSLDRWHAFDTEREMELAAVQVAELDNAWLWAGITFGNISNASVALPEHIQYKIRMNSVYFPPLQSSRYLYWRSYPYDFLWDRQYWVYGFVYLQDMVESGIGRYLNELHNVTMSLPGTYTQMFPYPCWLNDKYLYVISRSLPMCLVISWVYIVAISTKRIVYEKELRLKEVMSVMGLTNSVHWTAWALTLLSTSSITNLLLVGILKLGEITIFSNSVLLFLLLTLYTLCNIAFCFLVSVFFVQSKLASVVSAVAYYVMYLPYTISSLQEEHMVFWQKMVASGSSTTAFGFAMLQISRFEEQGVGLQWSNFLNSPVVNNSTKFSFIHCVYMLLFDFAFYLAMALYFEKVLPSEQGFASLPWHFPFTQCMGRCRDWLARRRPLGGRHPYIKDADISDSNNIEPVAKHLYPGVVMNGLCKRYGGEDQPLAVDNLTLTLYRGQVTALLGHNGAGKTTAMSLLTGIVAPTSGTYCITQEEEDVTSIRDGLGVCPQHNILWGSLTIAEHLLFYGQLKGMSRSVILKEMEDFMRDVDLPLEKRNCRINTLSGGMKRKVSVAIAFLGHTHTLILDEPTAGVDPKARRDIWDMIVKNKRNRTILLSTHHMEEADVLGDRIAIMSQGSLMCCGSSLFLKRMAGGAYFLTVEVMEGVEPSLIQTVVESIFSPVAVSSINNNTIVLELETSSMDLFENVCRELDEMKRANEIASYGISSTSMEEVFLKLALDSDKSWEREKKLKPIPENNTINDTKFYELSPSDPSRQESQTPLMQHTVDLSQGWLLYLQQFWALLWKRFHYAKRDKKGIFSQVVLPALFIALAMSINLAVPVMSTYSPRTLSLSMFDYPNYIPFEFKTPPRGVKPFDQSIFKAHGLTYKDRFLSDTVAQSDKEFAESEVYPSKVNIDHGRWSLSRNFVPQYKVCDVNYELKQWEGAVPFPTPSFETESGDVFVNVTGNNLTEYLMITQPEYKLLRYSALTMDDNRKDIIPEYASPYTAKQHIAKTWYLNKGYHAQPAMINALNNLLLKQAHPNHYISVSAQAMNNTAASTSKEYILQGIPIMISIFIIVGLSFVPTSFVVYLVHERNCNSKHLQFCAGVQPAVYWVSNYVWDMVNFLMPTLVAVIVFLIFRQQAFVEDLGAVLLLIVFYGMAATPMMYPASFIFNVPSAAYVTLLCSNLFVAVTTSYSVFILERFQGDPLMMQYAAILDSLFLIFPPYCLGKGLVDLTYRFVMHTLYETMGMHQKIDPNDTVWRWAILGRHLVILPLLACFWLGVTIAIESYLQRRRKVVKTVRSNAVLTGDVEDERRRVKCDTGEDILSVMGLTKRYKEWSIQHFIDYCMRRPVEKYSHIAVKNITFGVKKGECFGLLGINGAGKTSTFGMLTGSASVSGGEAWLGGANVVTQLNKVQQKLGYCPQFDALIGSLTGKEMVDLFAALHGVKNVSAASDAFIKELGLEHDRDKQCKKYSGGNKRKLSAAIALVGNPEMLLLDEPTAGMDPGARRNLWDVIRGAKHIGRSILLTSHSMGECEVLCDRIAIMSKGRLLCVGTSHYLKQRYGSGYTATIKSSKLGLVIERVEDSIDRAVLTEQHHNMVSYSIPNDTPLTPLFSLLAALKAEELLDDYSVSQCSLEDVFINFARNSSLGEDEDHGLDLESLSSTQLNIIKEP